MMRTHEKTFTAAAGFTLVEAMMSVVIVSGVLVTALGTFGAISRSRQVQVDRAAASHLAQLVVAEVTACYYKDPTAVGGTLGPEAGEGSRTAFDDVDDYDGWTVTSPTFRDGAAMTDYANWKVAVRVGYADVTDPQTASNVDTGLKRIRVTVTAPGGKETTTFVVRAKDGAYEQAPYETTTYVTATGVSAKVGTIGKTIHGGAHPLNVTTSQ